MSYDFNFHDHLAVALVDWDSISSDAENYREDDVKEIEKIKSMFPENTTFEINEDCIIYDEDGNEMGFHTGPKAELITGGVAYNCVLMTANKQPVKNA